jgi:ABC transporter
MTVRHDAEMSLACATLWPGRSHLLPGDRGASGRPPDAGWAEVFGRNVVREPAAVRELIGLTGQFAAVDELLTGRENLEMFGRLFKLSGEQAHRRAGQLLERFDLRQAADRPARTYSGGMRRRLDIASSLPTRPPWPTGGGGGQVLCEEGLHVLVTAAQVPGVAGGRSQYP